MPKKPELPLFIEVKSSRRLQQWLVFFHGLALGASIANALPIGVKLALLCAICSHFFWLRRRLKNQQLIIKQSDALGWEISDGTEFKAVEIVNSTVITVFALFLHVKDSTRKQSLLIVNDALSDEDYRRLIVRLKTAAKKLA